MTENHNQKMKEWKMYDMENEKKCTLQKMIEKSHPENDRMENAQLENSILSFSRVQILRNCLITIKVPLFQSTDTFFLLCMEVLE